MKKLADWIVDKRAMIFIVVAVLTVVSVIGMFKTNVNYDTLTKDNDTTLVWTIINKTEKDIEIGEEYYLQVLKDKSFVDVPRLPEAAAFNLLSRDILSGREYSDRVSVEHEYGELESGRYRIVKEYTNKEKGSQKKENASEEKVSAEFDLP